MASMAELSIVMLPSETLSTTSYQLVSAKTDEATVAPEVLIVELPQISVAELTVRRSLPLESNSYSSSSKVNLSPLSSAVTEARVELT